MRTKDIIEGLTILQGYRDKPDGFDVGAEHDVLYAFATDRPLSAEDVARMIALGWHQEGRSDDGPEYDPEESWAAYV